MKTVKYTKEADFICLEDLPGTSTELTLVHVGQENCKPYHIFSGKKDEYVLHFITSGRGFYSASGKAWTLASGQMFLIYPDETVVYCSDSQEPWSYSWVGFSGFKAEYILKQCGFERDRLILSCPDASQLLSCFEEMFAHLTLDYSDALYRESVLLKLFPFCAFITQFAGTKTCHRISQSTCMSVRPLNISTAPICRTSPCPTFQSISEFPAHI